MKSTTSLLTLAYLAATAHTHGLITSPVPRTAGDAFGASCGTQVESQQTSDSYGNIQGELQVAVPGTDCNLWLCKGYKLADNTAKVQSYTAGQVVPMTVEIRAPHTGTANVSIVDTATNAIIGSPLIHWDVYATNDKPMSEQANNTAFEITIPNDLGENCATAGDCVIQWWWDARSIDQTYEACVDFIVDGSGAVASSVVASTPVTSTATPISAKVSTSVSGPTSAPVSSALSTSTSKAVIIPSTLITLVKSTSKVTSAVATTTATSVAGTVPLYGKCGGINHTGATTCVTGLICKDWNPYYSQCISA